MNITYEPKVFTVEIEGKEYEVAQRTEAIDKRLRNHDKSIGKISEFESNIDLINIILGEKACKQIFPKKENENLDRLAYIASEVLKVYKTNIVEINANKNENELKPMLNTISNLSDEIKTLKQDIDGLVKK